MKEEILFELDSLSRDPLRVKGFRFGKKGSAPSCVIVGPMVGNAINQLWTASRLVNFLRQKELENPALFKGEVLIVPTVNPYSFNMGKTFWPMDNTDIDVMFPGYDKGETTQRIAARLFEKTNDFNYAILLETRKDRSECIPHVKVLGSDIAMAQEAQDFGLDFIHLRQPTAHDTVSLNYNWQIWEAKSFSLISGKRGTLDKADCRKVLDAIIRFLSKKEIVNLPIFESSKGNIITNESVEVIKSGTAGLFDSLVPVGENVVHGQPLARIYHSLDGSLLQTIIAPCDGIISCRYDYPLIFQNAIAFRLIRLENTVLLS